MIEADRVLCTTRTDSSPSTTLSIDAIGGCESIVKSFDSKTERGAVLKRRTLMQMIVATTAMAATARSLENSARAFAEPDPIYATIRAYQAAKQAFDAACAKDPDAYLDDPALAVLDSFAAVAGTAPTTLEGFLTKLAFIGEVRDRTPDVLDDGAA